MKLSSKLLAPVNTTIISILGIGKMLIGIWLMMPFNSWSDYSPTLLPEFLIGAILFVIGVFITWFSLRINLFGLQIATTLGYLFWMITAGVSFAVHLQGTGWITSLIFGVYCFMISLNISVNRRHLK